MGMETNTNLIATANTTAGFAIGIVSKTAHTTGEIYFEVVRMNRQSRYVTISRHGNEADARHRANIEYKLDKRAA